jgi:chromosome segregation ATPase
MENNNGNKKLATVEVQVQALEKVIDRIDVAIEKLIEVATQIKTVIAVHEHKLEQQEGLNSQLYEQIERLHTRVSQGKEDRLEAQEKFEVRLDALDRWRWSLIGAATVGGFLISLVLQLMIYKT